MTVAMPSSTPRAQPASGVAHRLLAVVIGVAGMGLIGAGGYLLTLGGSAYYAVAGLGFVATATLLFKGSSRALSLYAAVVAGTLVWSLYEAGLDWWRLAPRGGVIVVLALALMLPVVSSRLRPRAAGARPGLRVRDEMVLAVVLIASAVVGFAALITPGLAAPSSLPDASARLIAGEATSDGDWQAYGRSWRGDNWSPLAQITPANVGRLKVAWSLHTGDRKRPGDPGETTFETQPIKVGDTLYLCTPHNQVLALDPETGRMRWRFDANIAVPKDIQHMSCRGVSYHDAAWPGATRAANGECPRRILMATNDARLIALDATTGQRCRTFGTGGELNLWRGMPDHQDGWYQFTSAPLVTRALVVLAGSIFDNRSTRVPSGVIRAFDVATGRLVWNFDPGNPASTTPIADGEHYSASSPNSWSTSAVDEALGLIYVPMGNGAVDQWGGARPATTERYASSILALDLATGRERWVRQTVHHDLWDMDVPSQPALVDLDIPGRGRVPALVQSTKTGNIFVLDRRTGEPVHAVREEAAPRGPARGDRLSPTQPASAVSFMPPRVREADMWGATMFDQLACRIAFRSLRYDGPFTPPSERGTLVYPGNFGVFDWGGLAIDPERQVAFANPNRMAFVSRLVPASQRMEAARRPGFNPNAGAPFAAALNPFLSRLGLPCQAPPWGLVAGLDLRSGRIAWMHANGTVRDQTPIPLPFRMGVPSLGGPIATRGGVAFMTATLDNYIRAYDVTTGREIWRDRLPAGGQATPMTYRSLASGRQFVIAVAGGHGSLGTKSGDAVIAYALPKDGAR